MRQIQTLLGILIYGASIGQAEKPIAGLVTIPGEEADYYVTLPDPGKPQNVPLKSVDTKATVRGWAVDVNSVLTYKNSRNTSIECQFVFPIPDNAAVYKFEATIGGRKLKASVENRNDAQKIYQDAVNKGQRAGLLESQEGSPDVYRILLGNMGAGEDAVVTLAYAMPLEREPNTGTLTVNLPVTLNPRYLPQSDISNPEIMSMKFHPNVKYVAVSVIPYTFTFTVDIDLGVGGGNKILDVKSGTSSDILLVLPGNNNQTASVALISPFRADHDFRIVIETELDFETVVYTEPGRPATDESGVSAWLSYDVAAAWFEPFGGITSGLSTDQYWLVVDRSGSMSGEKIENARTALIYFIKSLPVGCKFNIIGFGSTFDSAFSESAGYDDSSVEAAMAYANNVDADFGGTEILAPLQDIYNKRIPPGVERNFIIILTDGEVSNTNEVIDLARQNALMTTVYSIGIGEGASTALVNGVARVSNGVAEYVRSSQDRLQTKVVDILKMTRQSPATNVKLEWPENDFNVVLKVPNASRTVAMQGREVAQFAIIERTSDSIHGVSEFSAMFEDLPMLFSVPFSISGYSSADDPMPLHRLAAKAKLVELKGEYYSSYDDALKEQAIQISIGTGVLSEFTSIVAVDESGDLVKDNAGDPLFVGIERPTTKNEEEEDYYGGYVTQAYSYVGSYYDGEEYYLFTTRTYSRTTTLPANHDLQVLITIQRAMGGWRLDSDLASMLGYSSNVTLWTDVTNAISKVNLKPKPAHPDALGTLIGIAILRNKFGNFSQDWGLIEQKAVLYMGTTYGIFEPDVTRYVDSIASELGIVQVN